MNSLIKKLDILKEKHYNAVEMNCYWHHFDSNGDGLIDSTDYDGLFNEAVMCIPIQGELFRIAADLTNDGIIDGFDLSKLELQIMGTRAFDQTVEYYK